MKVTITGGVGDGMRSQGEKKDAQEGKPQLSLLPLDVLGVVARAYEYGLSKYTRDSWRSGFTTSRSIDAALRHISEWKDRGRIYDEEAYNATGLKVHHLGMAVFNLLAAIWTEMRRPELVDFYLPYDYSDPAPLDDREGAIIERRWKELYGDRRASMHPEFLRLSEEDCDDEG